MTARMAHILVVDDDPADVALFADHLEDAPFAARLDRAKDGVEALEMLRGGLRPDLVVLDIHMPRMDGFETLREMRADPELAGLKVIMLTTSDQEENVLRSFEEKADSFVTKPSMPDGFRQFMRLIEDFMDAYVWSVE